MRIAPYQHMLDCKKSNIPSIAKMSSLGKHGSVLPWEAYLEMTLEALDA